jgi:UV DNA damage repair endonuclease
MIINQMDSTDTNCSNTISPELGLVCVTASDTVRYRSLTRKRFLQLNELEKQEVLRNLYSGRVLYYKKH